MVPLTRLCVAARQRQTSEAAMNFAGLMLPRQSDDRCRKTVPNRVEIRMRCVLLARADEVID